MIIIVRPLQKSSSSCILHLHHGRTGTGSIPHSHRRSTDRNIRKVGIVHGHVHVHVHGHVHRYGRHRHRHRHCHRRDVKRTNMKMGSRTSTDDCSKKSFFSTDVNIGIGIRIGIGGAGRAGGDKRKRTRSRTRTRTRKRTSVGLWRRMIAWYTTKLETHPYTTKCITSGMIGALGDITCQSLEQKGKGGGGRTNNEKKNDTAANANANANANNDALPPSSSVMIEWERAARFFVLRFAVMAPAMHAWYGYLTRQMPGITICRVVKRTAIDQIFFTPFYVPVCMTFLRFLEEGPDLIMNNVKRKEMSEELSRDVPGVIAASLGVWIPATLINFRFVPGKFQVLYSNSLGFFWNIYLSWKLNRNGDGDGDGDNSDGQGNGNGYGCGHDNHGHDDQNLYGKQQ